MPPIGIAIAWLTFELAAVVGTTMAVAIMDTILVGGFIIGAEEGLMFLKGLLQHTITTQMTVRQPVTYRRIIYGKIRAAGTMTYVGLSGPKNDLLHMVLTLAGHQLTSIGQMYFDGALAWLNPGYNDTHAGVSYYYDLETDVGNPSNTSQPFPHLSTAIPDWDSTCLQRGCGKAHVVIKYDTKFYPSGAPGSIAFDVQGKQVYDPRSGLTAFSDNPALCLRDYLTDVKYGLGVDPATIDDSTVIAAANICDELVSISTGNVATIGTVTFGVYTGGLFTATATNNLRVGTEVTFSGFTYFTFLNGQTATVVSANSTSFTFDFTTSGGPYSHSDSGTATAGSTQKRFTCAGCFDAGQTRGDIIRSLLTSMAGYCIPPGDAWRIYAGAYQTPTVILGPDDLRGPVKMNTLISKRDLANSIQGTFVSPANAWQACSYPPYQSATYLAEDNNHPIWQQVDLPFTTDGIMAQRLAKIFLERLRRQKVVTLPCKLSAFQLQAGDTVMLTFPVFGFTEKIFMVKQCTVVQDQGDQSQIQRGVHAGETSPGQNAAGASAPVLGVDLILQETDANVYDWNPATDENTWLSPRLATPPDNRVVQPVTGLSATSGAATATNKDGIISDRILVEWTSPSDQFVTNGGSIEVYVSPHGAGTFALAGIADGADTQFYVLNVQDGSAYDVQVIAVNAAGASSDAVEVDNITASSTLSQVAIDTQVLDGVTYARLKILGLSGQTISSGSVSFTGSTFVKAQGSIVGFSDNSAFSYSSTSSSLSFWNTAYTVYMQDGTSYSIPANGSSGSPAWSFSSLSASTNYFFGAYYKISDGTVHFVQSDNTTSSGSQQWVAQTINGDGHIPLFASWEVPTPASGSGGGGGGSGGGGGGRDFF